MGFFTDYTALFQQIAESNKEILHSANDKRFSRINIEEVLTGLRDGIDWQKMILVLESYEGRLEDNGADNYRNKRVAAFMILKHVDDPDDFTAENQALDDTEVVVLQVVSYLKKEKQDYDKTYLRALDINSFRYFKVGPIFDNAYGWRVTFEYEGPVNLAYNEDKWQ